MKVVFFGSGKFVLPILEVLRKNFDLVFIVTTTDHQLNKETIKKLKKMNAPFAVLANFGLIIPPKILNLFPKGIFNIHPSLLPKYRGPTPGQTAILNGDKMTGVTIIKLDEEVDHGPILGQVEEPILSDDTADTLYERLFKIGAKLLSQNIDKYINPHLINIKGQIKASPQNHSTATFTKRLTRQDGYFDIKNPPPPEQLDRMIRAYYPWPGAWTTLRVKGKGLRVKFLPGKKVQVEGRRPMSFKDFLNGYPEVKEQLPSFLSSFFSNTSCRV